MREISSFQLKNVFFQQAAHGRQVFLHLCRDLPVLPWKLDALHVVHSTSLFAQFRPTSYSTQTGTKPTETFSRFAGLYICIFFHDGSFRVVSRVIFFQNVCIFARIEVWEIFIAVMTAVYLLIEMHQAFWEVSYVLIRLAIL